MARNIRFRRNSGPPITGKCEICGERTYLPFQCRRCLGIFCANHHFPENHSCAPLSKIIEDYKRFEESNISKNGEDDIQNQLNEKRKLIRITQAMYENGELSRLKYLETIAFFDKDIIELKNKLKQVKNSGTNSENEIPLNEVKDNGLEKPNRFNNAKFTNIVDERDRLEEITEIKNRCQFCYNPIIEIPFKCQRCGLSYCGKHRLPENHQCTLQQYTKNQYETNSFFKWILIFIILAIVIIGIPYFISQVHGLNNSSSKPVIVSNNSINISKTLNELTGPINSISGIAVETKVKQPEINISTLESRIHELIKEKRRQKGLALLNYDSKLANIAQKHSQNMAIDNFFDHINPNGEDPTARGLKSGYRCYKDYGSYYTDGIAENLFQNNLYDSITYYNGIPSYDWNTLEEMAQSTVDGWMNSPGHRQNILTSSYDKEGIGAAISSDNEVLITENFC